MKRWLMILPLLACPLFAEEETDREEEIRKLIEQLEKSELKKDDLDKIREALNRVTAVRTKFELVDPKQLGVVLELDMADSQEQIAGNWKEGDAEGRYTLKSLGKGRYKLDAELKGADGEKSTFKDEGTLAELRKKYKFLGKISFVSMVPGAPRWTARTNPTLPKVRGGWSAVGLPASTMALSTALGARVRRPSKDLEFHLKLPTETAWIVDSVAPGSEAAKLGLKKLDLITHADGGDLSELKSLKEAKKELTVVRRGLTMKLPLESGRDSR
ncbi:MAG: hypothetical protein ACYTHK_05720 [Planctomycetota bacterium]|jgi:hypothetical protein